MVFATSVTNASYPKLMQITCILEVSQYLILHAICLSFFLFSFLFFFSSDKMFIINQCAILKTCFNVMLLSPCPSAFSGISLFRQ